MAAGSAFKLTLCIPAPSGRCKLHVGPLHHAPEGGWPPWPVMAESTDTLSAVVYVSIAANSEGFFVVFVRYHFIAFGCCFATSLNGYSNQPPPSTFPTHTLPTGLAEVDMYCI